MRIALTLVMIVILSSGVLAITNGFSGGDTARFTTTPNFQNYYSSSSLSTYWPVLNNRDVCEARQDVLIQVSPAGCQPAVVRSDLLAEQNVPVFCQIDALELNPLIDITQIRNIRFRGNYPSTVVGAGYHPAQAALRTRSQLLGSPIINNVGYVVVVLKKTPNESSLPDFVNLNLSARIDYSADNVLGVGRSEFLLHEVSDADWQVEKLKQTFLRGQYSIRLDNVDPEQASVSIYNGDRKVGSTTVKEGSSQEIFLPGSYCQFSLRVNYNGLIAADKTAVLHVNDDTVEVYKGSRFLNNKCVVQEINSDGFGMGNVKVRCGSENFDLKLSSYDLSIGEEVVLSEDVSDENPTIWTVSAIDGDKVNITSAGVETKIVDREDIVSYGASQDKNYGGEVDLYYNESIESYLDLVDSYPAEANAAGQTYGETALIKAIALSSDLGKGATAAKLVSLYKTQYPESFDPSQYQELLAFNSKFDTEKAVAAIEVDNDLSIIRLASIREPSSSSKAFFVIGKDTRPMEVEQGDSLEFRSSKGDSKIILESVDVESARVSAVCGDDKESSKTIDVDQTITMCDTVVKLDRTELEKYAKISLTSGAKGPTTETNLTVNIGIEKRALELSPSKTEEKLKRLNETIEQWESISNKLGETVKGLKAACFATAGVLTVKNFFTGLSGEALARKEVMSGSDGWSKRCADLVTSDPDKYPTLTACYNEHAEDIAADVSAYTTAIASTNSKVESVESGYKTSTGGFFGGESVDRDKAAAKLADDLKREHGNEKITLGNGTVVSVGDIADSRDASYEELRDLYFGMELREQQASEDTKKNSDTDLAKIANRIYDEREFRTAQEQTMGIEGKGYAPVTDTSTRFVTSNIAARVIPKTSQTEKAFSGIDFTHTATLLMPAATADITPDKQDHSEKLNAGFYSLALTQQTNNQYKIEGVSFVKDSGESSAVDVGEFVQGYGISTIRSEEQLSYNNPFKETPQVKYYETEPYKGMPALVPLDKDDGWYVATQQSLPGFGGIKAFESSGRPVSFWICNVMEDGRVGFFSSGFGGDQCAQFNLQTGQPLNKFPGLSEQKTQSLVNQAVDALNQAATARQQGRATTHVIVGGQTYDVGNPAALISGSQCQDFMSPEDCKLLFNVCDPVICPSSRCDLGGTYHVPDVIQTGVVGSALLCLPNAREGIAVPVCLTGINAGIEGYLSILKSHQQCLQENLETGVYTGICDEITAVYTCEFFWRQAAPLANILLPKMVEFAYGQGQARGGGEYLTTQNAWDNTQASIDYFTNSYAANSFEAFKIRSVEEAGTPVCRAFLSIKGPKSFETLIEPESPPQFHAYFSTAPFSDATVPATEQYKVFYHIFAGNDRGVTYSVYLKDPPQTSYYQTTPYITVASGFVAKGQAASETKDFTAPEGYQQLCVRINNDEECGFKQVSTSFAVNYVRDKVVSEEIKKEGIMTAQECVAGGTNPSALLNPNLGEIAGEAANPAVYDRGIIRICATANPGQGTDPTRFIDVGQCDDPGVRCWLDQSSVDNAITVGNVGVRNETISELQERSVDQLIEGGVYYSEDQSDAIVRDVGMEVDGLKSESDVKIQRDKTINLLAAIDDDLERVLLNNQKAQLLLSRATALDLLARSYFAKEAKAVKNDLSRDSTRGVSTPREKYTLTTAIQKASELKGDYSKHKQFIDDLCTDKVLSEEDCAEIRGDGVWNLQEDMDFVRNLLNDKYERSRVEPQVSGEPKLLSIEERFEVVDLIGEAYIYYRSYDVQDPKPVLCIPTDSRLHLVQSGRNCDQGSQAGSVSPLFIVRQTPAADSTIRLTKPSSDCSVLGNMYLGILEGARVVHDGNGKNIRLVLSASEENNNCPTD